MVSLSRSVPMFALAILLPLLGGCQEEGRTGGGQDTGQPVSSPEGAALGDPQAQPLPPGVPASYRENLQAVAQMYGIESPPETSVERVVTNLEQPEVMAACMTEQGIPTEVSPDGRGWQFSAQSAQADAVRLAEYVCLATFPLAAQFSEPFDAGQLGVQYAWLRDEVIPCMRSLGYPTPQMPSLQTFVAQYEENRGLWFPDTELDPATLAEDMAQISRKCELYPPDELLYDR